VKIAFLLNNSEADFYMPLTVTDDQRGSARIVVPISLDVSRGDSVEIKVDGTTIFKGEVKGVATQFRDGIKNLLCSGVNETLYKRYILDLGHYSYSDMDAGAIVKDLVDYYFASVLTSNNVNTSTGQTISIDGYGKTVGEVIEDIAERAGCCFYIDFDNDVHFFLEGTESSGETISSNQIFNIETDMKDEVVNKVIIEGRNNVFVEVGSGLPERYFRDRRISTVAEATLIGQMILNQYRSNRKSIKIETSGFYGFRAGQTINLNLPEYGFSGSSEIVRRITYNFGRGKASTNIIVGDADYGENPFEWALRKLRNLLDSKRDDYMLNLDEVDDGSAGKKIRVLSSLPLDPSDYQGIYVYVSSGDLAGLTFYSNGSEWIPQHPTSSYRHKYHIRITGESIDGWLIDADFGSVTAEVGKIEFDTGQQAGVAPTASIASGDAIINNNRSPHFKCRILPDYDSSQTIRISIFNIADPFDAWGFIIDDATIYAYEDVNYTRYQTEVGSITARSPVSLEAYYDYDNGEIKFYVNDVLEHTETSHLPTSGDARIEILLGADVDLRRTMKLFYFDLFQEWS